MMKPDVGKGSWQHEPNSQKRGEEPLCRSRRTGQTERVYARDGTGPREGTVRRKAETTMLSASSPHSRLGSSDTKRPGQASPQTDSRPAVTRPRGRRMGSESQRAQRFFWG